jgi:alpha-tubulin suppressor-like RCC1 family protein
MPRTFVPTSGVQYSGIWTMQQVNAAIAAGTWTGIPQLYTWGANGDGQLGLNNTTAYSSPKQVGSGSSWSTSFAGVGLKQRVLIKIDGSLWSWGRGALGVLGLGNTTSYSSPKQVGSLTNWLTVAASQYAVGAIKTDGTLWTWGYNDRGQLGLGNRTYYSSPKQVGALTAWSKIASSNCMLAIKTDGTLWSWGGNNLGQLGLGNLTYYSSPKQVGSLTNWSSVASLSNFSLATKTDGTLWAWGANNLGQLGDGTITNRQSPVQIGALNNWLTLTAAYSSACGVIKTDGTLWTWGQGSNGKLGLGDTTNRSSPVQVGSLTTWLNISGGYQHMMATKTDGTLWTWGRNNQGQLGLGNATSYSSPKQVGSLTGWLKVSGGQYFSSAIFK